MLIVFQADFAISRQKRTQETCALLVGQRHRQTPEHSTRKMPTYMTRASTIASECSEFLAIF